MGGARHGKGKGVYQASFGVYEGCSVPYIKFWFHALRFRCKSKGRRFLQALAFAACFFAAGLAYAVPGYQSGLAGVIQGPSAWYEYGASVDDPYYGYFCYAYDKYEAAVWSLGLDPTDASFTAEAKAKLSNASTGGRFYTYADKFHTFGASSEPHAWLSRDFYGQWVTLYGRDFLYWGEVTTAEQDGAKADLQTILDGGNLGGGGGGSGSGAGNKYTLSKDMSYTYLGTSVGTYDWKIPLNGTGISLDSAPLTCEVVVSDGLKSKIDSWLSSGRNVIMYIDGTNNRSYPNPRLNVMSLTSNTILGTVTDTLNRTYLSINSTGDSAGVYSDIYRADVSSAVGVPSLVYTYNSYFTGYTSKSIPMPLHLRDLNNASRFQYWGGYQLVLYSDGTASTPQIPETNWPESEPAPTPQPPDVPDPDTPTTEPQPDSPTPQTNPSFPVYVDVSTTTYTVDLQGVLDAMNDHCIHLQNALHTQFSDFWTVLSTKMTNDFSTLRQFLHGQFGWLGETIQDEMSETRDYLKELFEWLADQFDFTISGGGYNDSTVVSWLKKIYSKLGTGTSSRPVDPVADPDQTGSWLDTLINNLLTALEDLFPGLIGQVADFFGGTLGNLTQKFPFSIPWDVAAILGMLVAEPVAPSVEIPAYTLTNEGLAQVGTYDIDLSDYDAAWGAVRIMMRIAFALYVCVHTKDFLEVLERVMM